MAKKSNPSLIEEELGDFDIGDYDEFIPKTKKRGPRKAKSEDDMASPANSNGLKGIKGMMQDQVEIKFMEDLLAKKDISSGSKKDEGHEDTKAKTQNALNNGGINPMFMNPQLQNMDPQQLMMMSMMSNPQTAILYMMMNQQNKGGDTSENVDNLKGLAEIISVLKNDKPASNSNDQMMLFMLQEMMKKNNQPPAENNMMMQMMKMQMDQQQQMTKFWEQKAREAEEISRIDPIQNLLQSKENLMSLQAVFGGGSPEDRDFRMKQFEADLLDRKRAWDREDKTQQMLIEEEKSKRNMNLISNALSTLTEKIISPVVDNVKAGLAANPNGFEAIDAALPPKEPMAPVIPKTFESPQLPYIPMEAPIPQPFVEDEGFANVAQPAPVDFRPTPLDPNLFAKPLVEMPQMQPLKPMGKSLNNYNSALEREHTIPRSRGGFKLP